MKLVLQAIGAWHLGGAGAYLLLSLVGAQVNEVTLVSSVLTAVGTLYVASKLPK